MVSGVQNSFKFSNFFIIYINGTVWEDRSIFFIYIWSYPFLVMYPNFPVRYPIKKLDTIWTQNLYQTGVFLYSKITTNRLLVRYITIHHCIAQKLYYGSGYGLGRRLKSSPQNFFCLSQLLGSLTIGLVGDLGIWCAGRKKKGNP